MIAEGRAESVVPIGTLCGLRDGVDSPHTVRGVFTRQQGDVIADDGVVEVSQVRWLSPLPGSSAPHPDAIDHLSYLRYRLADGPDQASRADAVLVIQPGNYCGCHSLDGIARAIVRSAASKGQAVEFWALARRTEGLDDASGVRAAVAAGNPDLAFNYYLRGVPVGGRTFEGFKTSAGMPFLAGLGFAQVVSDMRETIERGVPDPTVRRQKVFVGGHSGGAIAAAAFGAWDFDGIPGYDLCKGFIALDTPVDCDFGLRTNPILQVLGWPVRSLAGAIYPLAVAGLNSGLLPRFSGAFVTLNVYLTRLLGTYAYLTPDTEARVLQRADALVAGTRHRWAWRAVTRLMFSATPWQALIGRPDPLGYRLTSEAELGMWLSTGVSPNPGRISFGTIDGPQRTRTFPMPAWTWRVPVLRGLVAFAFGHTPLRAAADHHLMSGWRSTVGPTQPVDVRTCARALMGARAPA